MMLKRTRENRPIACLMCWKCHSRTGPNHFKLEHGGATCSLCGDLNPLTNLRRVPLSEVQAAYEILLCFVPRDGYNVHALHIDCKTVLGPWIHIDGDAGTLARMMVYLGATAAQMAAHEQAIRSWGQGSSHIRLLPNRKNLLRIDYRKL